MNYYTYTNTICYYIYMNNIHMLLYIYEYYTYVTI